MKNGTPSLNNRRLSRSWFDAYLRYGTKISVIPEGQIENHPFSQKLDHSNTHPPPAPSGSLGTGGGLASFQLCSGEVCVQWQAQQQTTTVNCGLRGYSGAQRSREGPEG